MDFAFFESLTLNEARAYLQRYIEVERESVAELLTEARLVGLATDYTIDSLAPLLNWLVKQMRTVRVEPDLSLPEWIRTSDSYQSRLFEFDDHSQTLILRASYYLGETFVRQFPALSWTTGNQDFIQCNMPVIAGFRHQQEMPPMLIVLNLFSRIIARGADSAIANAVELWVESVP